MAPIIAPEPIGYRIFYRLAAPKHRMKKRLFEFLQDAYKNEEQLQADKKRLKEAIEAGSCTHGEWKPYSAVGGIKACKQIGLDSGSTDLHSRSKSRN